MKIGKCIPLIAVPCITALLLLQGCAMVGPDYVPRRPAAPAQWRAGELDGLRPLPAAATLAAWWAVLDDPLLAELEERATQGNLGLREALARVREARALRGVSAAKLWPELDAAGSAVNRRDSENTGAGGEYELYAAGFDAGWEIDVFGGRRRAVEAADADLAAEIEQLRDVLVSVAAEVALNYIGVRTFQTRLAVADANLADQRQTYELNRSRHEAGLLDELAVQQARYNLEHTRSRIPALRAGLTAAKNRLAVLAGAPPGSIDALLTESRPVPVPPVTVAVGVPAETLRRRPDIRAAERRLAAQTARIGVATADLYPKFRLLGSIGLESLQPADLPEGAGRAWGIGPSVSWRIFDAGAIRRNIDVQTARQEQALTRYEAAVLRALEEVENALVHYAREQLRRDALAAATAAAERAVLLARDRYRAGLEDFGNVLDAQRSLLSFQDELAVSEGTVTANLVRLYKALGGGWPAGGDGD
ncbi:MAG: efflux transporter outer membrane subunit [Deltaproteobacteria bacterium]|nr:efflux transporter outer membrane subunit [Candidatus Anaeroferrophillacea bacterium]